MPDITTQVAGLIQALDPSQVGKPPAAVICGMVLATDPGQTSRHGQLSFHRPQNPARDTLGTIVFKPEGGRAVTAIVGSRYTASGSQRDGLGFEIAKLILDSDAKAPNRKVNQRPALRGSILAALERAYTEPGQGLPGLLQASYHAGTKLELGGVTHQGQPVAVTLAADRPTSGQVIVHVRDKPAVVLRVGAGRSRPGEDIALDNLAAVKVETLAKPVRSPSGGMGG